MNKEIEILSDHALTYSTESPQILPKYLTVLVKHNIEKTSVTMTFLLVMLFHFIVYKIRNSFIRWKNQVADVFGGEQYLQPSVVEYPECFSSFIFFFFFFISIIPRTKKEKRRRWTGRTGENRWVVSKRRRDGIRGLLHCSFLFSFRFVSVSLSRDRKSADEHQHENVNDHNDGGNKNTVAFIFEFGAMLLSRISYSDDSHSFHFQRPFKYLTSLESFVTLSSL